MNRNPSELSEDPPIEVRLRWFLDQRVVLLKEEMLEDLPRHVDGSNIDRLLQALEGSPTATQWEKAVVVLALAPKRLPQVRKYALGLRPRLRDPDAVEEVDEALEHYRGDMPRPSIRIYGGTVPPEQVSVREPIFGRGEAPEEAGDYKLEVSVAELSGALGPGYRALAADHERHASFERDPTIRALRHCEWRPLRTLARSDPGLLASLISEHMAGETLHGVVPGGGMPDVRYCLCSVDRVAVQGERVMIHGRAVRFPGGEGV